MHAAAYFAAVALTGHAGALSIGEARHAALRYEANQRLGGHTDGFRLIGCQRRTPRRVTCRGTEVNGLVVTDAQTGSVIAYADYDAILDVTKAGTRIAIVPR
jgi:hypothetical protein